MMRWHVSFSWLSLTGFLAAITALTAAQQTGAFSLGSVAATTEGVGDGRVWLVLSSALVAQTPVVLSLASFGALGFLVLRVCGPRTLWLSAAVGHLVSTLVVYGAVGTAALADGDLVRGLLGEQDYGVSAIFAAWLGAVAAYGWVRCSGAWRWRLAVVLGCLGVGLAAWLIRGEPTPSILDSEHIVAFAIGATIAVAPIRRTPAGY
jgi:hypothetical protein